MEGFQVTEIGEKIYCILDAGNSSFYVVEGEEKAAVIDTGITAGAKILPVIRELTGGLRSRGADSCRSGPPAFRLLRFRGSGLPVPC